MMFSNRYHQLFRKRKMHPLLSSIVRILVVVYGIQVLVSREYMEGIKSRVIRASEKPLLVLYPGPRYMQTAHLLDTLSLYRKELKEDGYTLDIDNMHRPLLGTYCRKHVSCCGGCEMDSFNMTKLNEIDCIQDLINKSKEEIEQNHNVMIVSDLMGDIQAKFPGKARCPTHWKIWEHVLKDWRVKVVVGYRRYFEWLIARKIEEDVPARYRNFKEWPDHRGTTILPIWDHLMGVLHGNATFYPFPFTTDIVDAFQNHFDVSVWNMHDSFICNELPSANHACQAYSLNGTVAPFTLFSEKSTHKIFYDLIAVAAHDGGIVNSSLSRPFVVSEVKRRQEIDLGLRPKDFPLSCPSGDELEQNLLSVSLEYEKQLLPDFFASSLGEAAHRKAFSDAVDRQVFCTVDLDAVLQDPEWQEFLHSLVA